mmetsp:Transcript_31944/g.75894  ORF Transcript_31944/g.75894 Transcript_31944/m.75894 type:complete len:210 (+) Transcript_31944:682-1311(+)
MTAPRSFSSRYIFEVSYARNTAWTAEKRRVESRMRFVKMNSKREPLNFVSTYRACAVPRRRDCAERMLMLTTDPYPTVRFVRYEELAIQIIRRFVTCISPLSPLFPLVSSIEFMQSITTSPRRSSSCSTGTSNRISRSYQSRSVVSGPPPEPPNMFILPPRSVIWLCFRKNGRALTHKHPSGCVCESARARERVRGGGWGKRECVSERE